VKVFVTGATGYIGSAVVRELAAAGHEVAGLTRLAERTAYVEELGGRAVMGDVRDAGAWRDEAAAADVLIHVAAEDSESRRSVDRMAIDTLVAAARGRGAADAPRGLIYTSGCFVLGDTGGVPAAEDAPLDDPAEVVSWRPAHERRVLDADSPELATSVIRPGMVYGGKDGQFATFFASAERDGAAEFVGDGTNRWSPVYRGDVARLYRLVAERRGRGVFHCAEPAQRVGDLAVTASRAAGAGGATSRVRLEAARRTMGPYADALALDQVMAWPRAEGLGWAPEHAPFRESADAVYREWKD
jgi:nucleoside-diphosphate-sugar epimerase